ncbi:MAG: hypothetical protein NT106_07200 [Candidatus Sumerlaeota bacterium]|nr:hypothetical protein [Candidatus Sumerlaeota bacterium]
MELNLRHQSIRLQHNTTGARASALEINIKNSIYAPCYYMQGLFSKNFASFAPEHLESLTKDILTTGDTGFTGEIRLRRIVGVS